MAAVYDSEEDMLAALERKEIKAGMVPSPRRPHRSNHSHPIARCCLLAIARCRLLRPAARALSLGCP